MGVDTFYLYDTGSKDDTIEVLSPWMEAGIVKLHQYEDDQGINYQMSSLRHCSSVYGPESEWILESDVDEFYVPTESFTGYSARDNPSIYECPISPLAKLLEHWIYLEADALAVSRVTVKNQGIFKLDEGTSVLASQTLRDLYHGINWPKLEFTKTILHSRKKIGWIIPWAHGLKHISLPPNKVNIISVVGEQVVGLVESEPEDIEPGTYFSGGHPTRTFEPLVRRIPRPIAGPLLLIAIIPPNTNFYQGHVSAYREVSLSYSTTDQ